MSILVDLSTTPYNYINTMDEFNEEYKKSDHIIANYLGNLNS
jgi:hypothetical protein